MRKTSRGASRTQRRRRSKSPILHPPKFTYCSAAAAGALSPPSGCLKHQRLAVPEPPEPRPTVNGLTPPSVAVPAQKELPPSAASSHVSPLVFGSCAGYDTRDVPSVVSAAAPSSGQDGASSGDVCSSEDSVPPKESACDGAGAARREAADFRSLSELHSSCSCAQRSSSESQEESGGVQAAEPPCRCRGSHRGWSGVEVYSFTGLRNVISECERSLPTHEDTSRTLSGNAAAATASSALSGSPRSCSEQARAYVDDITIEDLSGYMEYYLYIPKKMSHMAEMMYT